MVMMECRMLFTFKIYTIKTVVESWQLGRKILFLQMGMAFAYKRLVGLLVVIILRIINSYMNYDEYLKCAEKHLKSCQQLLGGLDQNTNNREAYLDLWYISGYIIEGLTVYSVYKNYDWDPNIDIQYCHPNRFTPQCWNFYQATKLDFYGSGGRIDTKTGNKLLGNISIKYSVKGHNFQLIIDNLLKKEAPFKDFPILGLGKIDPNVSELVKNWRPNIRYWYKEEQMKMNNIPDLTIDLLTKLIDTCEDVYKRVIFV